jgi:hypothetical protein
MCTALVLSTALTGVAHAQSMATRGIKMEGGFASSVIPSCADGFVLTSQDGMNFSCENLNENFEEFVENVCGAESIIIANNGSFSCASFNASNCAADDVIMFSNGQFTCRNLESAVTNIINNTTNNNTTNVSQTVEPEPVTCPCGPCGSTKSRARGCGIPDRLMCTQSGWVLTQAGRYHHCCCFPGDTLVEMADGSFKRIDQVRLGEKVRGLYGYENEVLALQPVELGNRTLWEINGEVFTTADHPFWTGKGFGVLSMREYIQNDYGRPQEVVVDENGSREIWTYPGTDIAKMTEVGLGDTIAFNDETRVVETLKAHSAEPDMKLYSLVLGGSHTMRLAGGYVFSGWARDDDFDYQSGRQLVEAIKNGAGNYTRHYATLVHV